MTSAGSRNGSLTADSFLAQLRSDGLVHSTGACLMPLSGGVSSEIYRVDDGGESFVVKRALPRLKVADEWIADVTRNTYENRYLAYVGRFLPRSVPALRVVQPEGGYFAMEYLGPEYRDWKKLLLEGHFDLTHATVAANTLGSVHRRSRGDPEAATLFDSGRCFYQLRLEPYLLTTGRRHPKLKQEFEAEAKRLENTTECLVHGDYSPKNILISDDRMVILDSEAAWYGDPAFDVAFLLNHLFLKSLFHLRETGVAAMMQSFWQEYSRVSGIGLEYRVTKLILMLLLARIDGKSPVEYIQDTARKQFVRNFVYAQLSRGTLSLAELSNVWFADLASFRDRS